jgi:transcriptional regulator with XRE-family HTH domain
VNRVFQIKPKSLGKRIRLARIEAELSQEELGLLCLSSQKMISSYETEQIEPKLSTLRKLAKELDKPLSYFLEEFDNLS